MHSRSEKCAILAGVAAVSAIAALALRMTPLVQGLELNAYDTVVAMRASPAPSGNPIALATYDETLLADDRFFPHPIPDADLGKLLDRLARAGATVIAVDIYRGTPVPRGAPESVLNQVLLEHENIIMVRDIADDSPIRRAPNILKGNNQRVGIANFPMDVALTPVVRRAFLTIDSDGETYLSLAFLAALQHLSAVHGLGLELIDGGGDETHYRVGGTTLRPFRSNDGAYVDAETDGFQVILDFPHRGSYPEQSMRWIMEAGDDALRQFAGGRIVFVGITAGSIKDTVATPLEREHRGLPLHAAFADQLLGTFLDPAYRRLRVSGNATEILIVLSWAALAALGALALRGIPARVAVLVGGILVIAALSGGLLFLNVWIPIVTPMIGFGIALVGATTVVEVRQRRTAGDLEDLLRRHLGPKQFTMVWGEREALLRDGSVPGRQGEATIMMTDLTGYSSVSEKLAGDTLLSWLNRIHETMEQAISDHQGMVKAIIGDAIYAVFGIPEEEYRGREGSERQRRDALMCALDMRHRLGAVNKEFAAEGLPEAAMRIGINTGTVTLGTLGSEKGMEYAIIGDVVNTAARLESHDKNDIKPGEICRIIAGEITLAGVADRFDTENIGKLQLKGKARKIQAFRILGAKTPG